MSRSSILSAFDGSPDVPPELGPRFLPVAVRCPDCRDEPSFTSAPTQPLAGGVFGVLTCSCRTYPVLDSIPIMRSGRVDVQDHMTGRAEVAGPDVEELVDLVRADRGLDALIEMLAFPPPVPFGWGGIPGLRLPFTRGPWPRLALEARRGEVAAMLADLDALTAQDWMELCYERSTEKISRELLPYFFVRFGQPRFLASMSLLRALPDDPRPILDLACGFGHVMYHLSQRERPVRSVGVDRNFFQLWVGRRYVAPTEAYVCSDRLTALPFPDDVFSASVCTDAFHLFDVQQECLDELRRVADRETVVLDRIGNACLEPFDTDQERTPRGYVNLLRGAPSRLTCEDELVAGYRAGHGPRLATSRDPADLDESKWLSLITCTDESLFVDDGGFDAPPHAAGALRLNPIFSIDRSGGDVHLAFSFPSVWYAFENALMSSYTSAGERLDEATFHAVARGRPTGRTPALVRRFVLQGMPPRYARPPGEPPRHGSMLTHLLERRRRRSGERGRADRHTRSHGTVTE